MNERCTMGIGCDEAGVCFADAHGEPDRCPKGQIRFPRETKRFGECLAFMRKDGTFNLNEYMRIPYEGESWLSHRLSFHLNCEEIPVNPPNRKEGLILHTCDHKWCIEPAHVYKGTCKQNWADTWNRHPDSKHNALVRNLGKKASTETRLKMSASKVGNTNHTGKLASVETKAKMSLSKIGNTNKAGTHYHMWITDGQVSKYVLKTSTIPQGWRKGRSYKIR